MERSAGNAENAKDLSHAFCPSHRGLFDCDLSIFSTFSIFSKKCRTVSRALAQTQNHILDGFGAFPKVLKMLKMLKLLKLLKTVSSIFSETSKNIKNGSLGASNDFPEVGAKMLKMLKTIKKQDFHGFTRQTMKKKC
tara:strand:- start:95 stop:505 length:411 start_codon:yes stop_codon:yes gene_type:complete